MSEATTTTPVTFVWVDASSATMTVIIVSISVGLPGPMGQCFEVPPLLLISLHSIKGVAGLAAMLLQLCQA